MIGSLSQSVSQLKNRLRVHHGSWITLPPPVPLPRGVLIDTIYLYLFDTVFDKTVSIRLFSIDTIIDTYRYRHSWLCSSSITHDLTNCSGNKNYSLFQFQ